MIERYPVHTVKIAIWKVSLEDIWSMWLNIRWPSNPSQIFRDSPEFCVPVPKNEVIRDAELSWIPNPVPNLSRFNVEMCCSSSSWSECNWSFWRFCLSEMRFVKLKTTESIFSRGSAPDPAGEVYDAPPDSLVGWGGQCPLLIPLLIA